MCRELPKYRCRFAIPAAMHTITSNPHYYGPKATRVLNHTLAAYDYALIERRDSITGYISVLQNKKDGFTAMRCDHSILGGEWDLNPDRMKQGQIVKETIYSAFTMLEAVRLIKTDIYSPDTEKDALFMYVPSS